MDNILDCKKYIEANLPGIYSSTKETILLRSRIYELVSIFDRQMVIDIASSTVKARFDEFDFFNKRWAMIQREIRSYEKLSLNLPANILNAFVEALRFEAYKVKITKKEEKQMILNEIYVSRDGMIGKYNGVYTSFRMPSKSKYYGFVYCVYNSNIRDTFILNGKTQEEAYILRFKEKEKIKLFVKDKVVELTLDELYDEVDRVPKSEYKEANEKVTFSIKDRNIVEYRPQSIHFKLTNFEGKLEEMDDYHFYLPNAFTKREPCGNKVLVKTPEGFKVSVYRESDHAKCDTPINMLKDYMQSNYYNPQSDNTKKYAYKIKEEFSKENGNDK